MRQYERWTLQAGPRGPELHLNQKKNVFLNLSVDAWRNAATGWLTCFHRPVPASALITEGRSTSSTLEIHDQATISIWGTRAGLRNRHLLLT